MEVVVQEGALFFDLSRPDRAWRNWYEFAPAAGRCYLHTAVEGLDEGEVPGTAAVAEAG